jgi:hypothetical protein
MNGLSTGSDVFGRLECTKVRFDPLGSRYKTTPFEHCLRCRSLTAKDGTE